MRHETSNFVAKSFCWNARYFFGDLFIDLEVHRQFGIVLLDDLPSCLLDGFSTDATLEKGDGGRAETDLP